MATGIVMHFYVWQRSYGLQPVARIEGISVDIWRPLGWKVRPEGFPHIQAIAWRLFHSTRIFANREYGVVLVRARGQVVHHSLVTPRYFRFPEMGLRDVQIGATSTNPAWQGRGLAKTAVRVACEHWGGRVDRIWYLVKSDNAASIRVIESCGFRLVGSGCRVNRLGLRVLGQYRLAARPVSAIEAATG